mmetsp:Transcript_34230/g.80645  ORF Transcript_34230/g.80645 Transcript_34230/m.80645 type:complete len:99 (+) Transcript_34230:2923-3219(+)
MQGKGRQLGPIKRSTTPRMSFRLRKELAKPHLWAQQSIAQLGGVRSMLDAITIRPTIVRNENNSHPRNHDCYVSNNKRSSSDLRSVVIVVIMMLSILL